MEAAQPEMVTLVSAEGVEFRVDKRAACMSKAISNMLAPDSAFLEAKSGKVRFEEIKSEALAMVVKFMEYRLKLMDRSPTEPVPEFKIPPEIALELLVAADFLDL